MISCVSTFVQKVDQECENFGKFLDRHPTLYKVALVACHVFRAIGMFAIMAWSPLPMAVTCGLMLVGSVLYRLAVERFCCFRFTLASCAGGASLWAARASVIDLVSGAALESIGRTCLAAFSIVPLVGYCVWIGYQSHCDIEERMKKINHSACQSCG